ncbi:MAG TPA: cyclase family protein, partial [Anaerolineales bacterium]
MDKRAQFDFEISFTNGGGIQGQGFRLDIPGENISDRELGEYLVRDLRLLMVDEVSIRNKRILEEEHKRASPVRIDLSHVIHDGLVTYKGLPAPVICDYLSREDSRDHYAPGTEFQIARIDMVANTGTYVDCPSHRYADGKDLSEVGLEQFSDLEGITVRAGHENGMEIGAEFFKGRNVRDKAVLVNTGWDVNWATDSYFETHPFLTEEAAMYLRDSGARLVGIDSMNIDDTRGGSRPVHSTLLKAGILIVEHLCGLGQLPEQGYAFNAIPPKVKGMGTFPVRAFARLE